MVPTPGHRSGEYLNSKQGIPMPSTTPGLDTPPYFLKGESPLFPLGLEPAKIKSGYAILRYHVTAAGRAADPRVVEASHPQFAAGVAYVMPTWRFRPATRKGVPVDCTIVQRFEFGQEIGEVRLKSQMHASTTPNSK